MVLGGPPASRRSNPGPVSLVSCAEADRRLSRFHRPVGLSEVPLVEAAGRVSGRDLVATTAVPAWPRSVMDGFALAAGDSPDGSFRCVGAVAMGTDPSARPPLRPGECVEVSTGGMLPPGADRVVMVEITSLTESGGGPVVTVHGPCRPGDNVQPPGDDVRPGQRLIAAGVRLRAAEIAALATFGVTQAPVFRRPRVHIFSTGDEIVPPDRDPPPGKVRDCNGYALAAGILEAGGDPHLHGAVRDDAAALRREIDAALAVGADLVLVSGGSSMGGRDFTADVLDALGPPGVILHGIDIRPGKPTVLAGAGGTPLVGMPGHPVSSLVIFHRFVRPLIWALAGLDPPPEAWPVIGRGPLAVEVRSKVGREDYVRVRLREDGAVAPLPGGSASLTSLLGAHGVVVVPPGCDRLEPGDPVAVLAL